MPLSVKVRLDYDDTPRTPYITINIRTDDGQGASQPINYFNLFNSEHVVFILPPEAGRPMKKKAIKKRSEKQETKRIEAVGGRRHSGSGSRAGYKSDGSVGNRYRMENKFTTAESRRVELKELRKLRSECLNGQVPVFNIDFQDKHTGATKESWVLIPTKEWEKLANAQHD